MYYAMKFFGEEKLTTGLPPTSAQSYSKLTSSDAPFEELDSLVENKQNHYKRRIRRLSILNSIFLVTSAGCLLLSALFIYAARPIEGSRILQEKTFYSPPLDTLKPALYISEVVTKHLDSNASVLRQDPSPQVDAAWTRFADMAVIGLTGEQVTKLGKDPALTAKAPPSWGVGNETYLAQLDAVHLAHCLDSMRKSLYYNFHHYYPDGIPDVYAAHLMHCQEALAKWLMCQPSMELLTFNWVQGHDGPFPDFDMTRKCWDYDQLLKWQDDHRVQTINTVEWRAMRAPKGAKWKPSPILYMESLNRAPFHG